MSRTPHRNKKHTLNQKKMEEVAKLLNQYSNDMYGKCRNADGSLDLDKLTVNPLTQELLFKLKEIGVIEPKELFNSGLIAAGMMR